MKPEIFCPEVSILQGDDSFSDLLSRRPIKSIQHIGETGQGNNRPQFYIGDMKRERLFTQSSTYFKQVSRAT